MKEKIKNGYFLLYDNRWYLKVGSRCYMLPIEFDEPTTLIMFKDLEEEKIRMVAKPDGKGI